jgi:ribonuclease Z
MRLTFLGTSSGIPTRERSLSGTALRFDDGRVWLVDCGEGAQHRLLHTDLRLARIDRILLTHLHGDHCFGLPGLLATMGMHGRKRPVDVAGPPGLERWLQTTLEVAEAALPFDLRLRELPEPGVIAQDAERTVSAVGLVHRVPSYAYVIREAPRRGALDAERTAALGVPDGPLRGRLAAGETVRLTDGRTVTPGQVLGPVRPGRVAVLCGDSVDSSALVEPARGCDVLVHECTYDAARETQARRWQHSTTAMVAALARAIRPRMLVLTHFSTRYTQGSDALSVADLRRQVAERCDVPDVRVAEDGRSLAVPLREPSDGMSGVDAP